MLYLLFLSILPLALADLRVGFYQSSCPNAESIILGVVKSQFNTDPSITAALLRMHFHDCFVRGCDASILIDSTNQNQAEKDSGPNQTVRGYELIDQIKKALEAACPGTVSCADIITVATRDAVALAGGPNYAVPTGRRDGLVSRAGDVNLPGPTVSVPQASQIFSSKGLTVNEMVTLFGAHTVGVAHCSFFGNRLPNDPSMNSSLATSLSRTCANSNTDPTVPLDQGTPFAFDNAYYQQLLLKKGIMTIDQELATDGSSSGFVSSFARDANGFSQSFANAMVKMGSIQVLLGTAGEVRTNCRVFNPPTKPTIPPPPPMVEVLSAGHTTVSYFSRTSLVKSPFCPFLASLRGRRFGWPVILLLVPQPPSQVPSVGVSCAGCGTLRELCRAIRRLDSVGQKSILSFVRPPKGPQARSICHFAPCTATMDRASEEPRASGLPIDLSSLTSYFYGPLFVYRLGQAKLGLFLVSSRNTLIGSVSNHTFHVIVALSWKV
ncbi:hypothetical protein Tsubulata_028790 [Turnera subulata]|uniref:peroxidase n=1 Tax=Turnera subulata TaxID=218843 RepID=A0A9Q0G426_9ROSI|nr:hypothetical protein Tsubulata_028790 [Turnera subulata]